eukprot:7153746-Alexandrium_andersonii.AAC.1
MCPVFAVTREGSRVSPAHAASPRPHARSFASPARTTRTRNRHRCPGGGSLFHFNLTPNLRRT